MKTYRVTFDLVLPDETLHPKEWAFDVIKANFDQEGFSTENVSLYHIGDVYNYEVVTD